MYNKDKYDLTKIKFILSKDDTIKDLPEFYLTFRYEDKDVARFQVNDCYSCMLKTYSEWLEQED